MSRLTGTDAYGLMEAYNNVYTPQELTEEQVWEEVETWVNSLIEEGYDLSDYTWEEMYESYINEKLKSLPKEKMERQAKKAYNKERSAIDRLDTPEANRQMQRRISMQSPASRRNFLQNKKMSEETDIFAQVLEHLVSEGYADTEESALVIMANMSEEWREEILEGRVASETMGSGERRWERNDRYREENPTLPSGNPTGVNAQLMRQMAHAKKRGVKKKKN